MYIFHDIKLNTTYNRSLIIFLSFYYFFWVLIFFIFFFFCFDKNLALHFLAWLIVLLLIFWIVLCRWCPSWTKFIGCCAIWNDIWCIWCLFLGTKTIFILKKWMDVINTFFKNLFFDLATSEINPFMAKHSICWWRYLFVFHIEIGCVCVSVRVLLLEWLEIFNKIILQWILLTGVIGFYFTKEIIFKRYFSCSLLLLGVWIAW